MLMALVPLLAGGVKGFFESPEFLLGVPLLVIGVLGVLLVLFPIELHWPVPQPAGAADAEADEAVEAEQAEEAEEGVEGHPSARQYVTVGLILAGITAAEVAIYYVDVAYGALLGMLLAMSLVKFVVVALWFMHLQFDSRIFSTLFAGGLALVIALFFVVLATLGASLV